MTTEIDAIRREASAALEQVSTADALDAFRITYLSRKGRIALLFDRLKDVSPADRPETGKALNALRTEVQSLFDQRSLSLSSPTGASRSSLDLTLPGRKR